MIDLVLLFAMKDLGPLHYFLGLKAHKVQSELYLTQTKYIWDLLQRTNMHDAKPIKSLVDSGSKLSKFSGDPLPTPHEYRSIVGALPYVTLTRSDIVFAIKQVCLDSCQKNFEIS